MTDQLTKFTINHFSNNCPTDSPDDGTERAWVEFSWKCISEDAYPEFYEKFLKGEDNLETAKLLRSIFFAGAIWQREKDKLVMERDKEELTLPNLPMSAKDIENFEFIYITEKDDNYYKVFSMLLHETGYWDAYINHINSDSCNFENIDELFESESPFDWISEPFTWNTTSEGHAIWRELDFKWCKVVESLRGREK